MAEWHSDGLREISQIGLHPAQNLRFFPRLVGGGKNIAHFKVSERPEGGVPKTLAVIPDLAESCAPTHSIGGVTSRMHLAWNEERLGGEATRDVGTVCRALSAAVRRPARSKTLGNSGRAHVR